MSYQVVEIYPVWCNSLTITIFASKIFLSYNPKPNLLDFADPPSSYFFFYIGMFAHIKSFILLLQKASVLKSDQ